MNRTKLRVIANNIILCERDIEQGKDVEFNQNKIEKYMSMLSMEDVLRMDEYIMKNTRKIMESIDNN